MRLNAHAKFVAHPQPQNLSWLYLSLLAVLLVFPKQSEATAQYQKDYINTVLPWAQQAHALYGVPISVAIAQSAKETGWYVANKNQNNYFDIKYTGPECDPFTVGPNSSNWRAYNSGGDAFLGYGYLLTHDAYYTGTGGAGIDCRPDENNPLQFLHDVAFDGFDDGPNASTEDKQQYYNIVASIISDNNLTQYDIPNGPSTDIYVDGSYSGTQSGTASNPYNTLAAAVNSASTTAAVTIHIKPGTYHEKLTVHKNIHFVTNGSGPVRIGG
jgi:hypothetical protein